MTGRMLGVTIAGAVAAGIPVAVVVVDAWLGWPSEGFYLAFAPANIAFALVAWLLAARQPGNVIGPLLLAFALVFASYFPIDLALRVGIRGPVVDTLAAISSASDAVGYIMVAMALVLFPDGRLPGPGWRWTVVVALGGGTLGFLGALSAAGPLPAFPPVDNPLGVAGAPSALGGLGYVSVLTLLVAAIAALVVRWRRGRPVERAQIKWVAAAAFVLAIAEAVNLAYDSPATTILVSVVIALVPISIGVAILRYRLYEIDRLISRTIGWALVTGILVAVFAGLVVGLQALLAPVTERNTLAVAASTLVAFALFQPVRRRVQHAVDRRFDRRRYDGERTAVAFSARMRGAIDLGGLEGEIVGTVQAALRPTSAALWIGQPHHARTDR